MDFFGLIFGSNSASTKVSGLYSLEMDAILEETQEWSSEVTTNPVESGSDVADHIRNAPDSVTLTGTVGNLDMRGRFPDSIVGQIVGLIDGSGGVDRPLTAFDIIRNIHKSRATVTLYTKWHTYEDMALVSVNIPRTASIGQAVQFTMVFKSIRVVSSRAVAIPSGIGAKNKVQNKASAQKKIGSVAPVKKEVPNVAKHDLSVLKGIFYKPNGT